MAALRTLLLALAAATVTNADNLKPCLRQAVSKVAFAGDLLYQAVDVEVYNLDYPVTPAAVAFPTTAEQVSAIVKCAANNGYPVQAKSGGHSYGNYGAYQRPY
jgi:FAD/FMN-containing dehydrogenase